jgi:hypothetical protein
MGGYVKRCMGLTLYFKIENPYGTRINQLFVDDECVRPDDVYDVCYVTTQGVPDKYGSDRETVGVDAIETLRRYVTQHTPVEADLRGTIRAI